MWSGSAAGVHGSVVGAADVNMFAGCATGLCAPCRLRDVLFLDLALELAGRGALEAGLSAVRAAAPSTLLGGLLALLQQPLASACMSALPGQGSSAALVSVAGQLAMLSQDCPGQLLLVLQVPRFLRVCGAVRAANRDACPQSCLPWFKAPSALNKRSQSSAAASQAASVSAFTTAWC